MASLYELRDLPAIGDYFLSYKDLLEVIQDVSVKHKFAFRVPYKDLKRVRYCCTNKECPWLVNAYRNLENENKITVDKVVLDYTYIGNAVSKFSAASC
jgi:hypothetical protein